MDLLLVRGGEATKGQTCSAVLKGFLLLVVTVLFTLACGRSGGSPHGGGTPLEFSGEPPLFQLTDQFGWQVSLEDFLGRPLGLTFLYTNCSAVCPLAASKLGLVDALLGELGDRVQFAAITVDPKRDSVAVYQPR